jgi:hypothetical protein
MAEKVIDGSMIDRGDTPDELYLQCGRCGWTHVHICGAENLNPDVLWHQVAMNIYRDAATQYREVAANLAPVIAHTESLRWAKEMLTDDKKLAAEIERRLVERAKRRKATQRAARGSVAPNDQSSPTDKNEP